ncbi:shikimate dehydrogenase, partial [Micromonospora carbonacea]
RASAIDELRPAADALGLRLAGADWADAAGHTDADVVVSTVPKGVAAARAPPAGGGPGAVSCPALYEPGPPPPPPPAAAPGCRVVSGLDLLVAQAVGQFEHFTGVRAPVAAMAAALSSEVGIKIRPTR